MTNRKIFNVLYLIEYFTQKTGDFYSSGENNIFLNASYRKRGPYKEIILYFNTYNACCYPMSYRKATCDLNDVFNWWFVPVIRL